MLCSQKCVRHRLSSNSRGGELQSVPGASGQFVLSVPVATRLQLACAFAEYAAHVCITHPTQPSPGQFACHWAT